MIVIQTGQTTLSDFMSGGLKVVLMSEEKQMFDERILGSGEFANKVLAQIDEIDEKKKYFKDLNDLIQRLSKYYKVSDEEILKTNKNRVTR